MSQLKSLSSQCECLLINSLYIRLPICSKLVDSVRHDIKLIHIFDNNKNVLFVTTDDRVFGFGHNESGVLGLGHNERVEQPIEVIELRDKKLKEFFVGEDFVVAISEDNRVFTWGHNNWGQLGRGSFKVKGVHHKPSAINLSLSEDIVQVCCERRHTLVLTSSGRVYGWGRNEFGEIGLSPQEVTKMSVPVQLKTLEGFGVKSIRIGNCCNFAVTTDGRLVTWARMAQSGQPVDDTTVDMWQPLVIENINGVVDVCVTYSNPETYLLTDKGTVNKLMSYSDGYHAKLMKVNCHVSELREEPMVKYRDGPRRLAGHVEEGVKVKAIYAFKWNVVALGTKDDNGEEWVYDKDFYKNELIKTDYKTFFDYFYIEHNKLTKTMMIHSTSKKSSCLFNDHKTNDFKIMIRGIDGKYEHIYCHKSVLIERSDYFRRMFAINWSESMNNEIEVFGYTFEAFYHYIRWLYTDCIATQDIHLLIQMLSISDQYLDNDFKDKCIEHLKSHTNVENVSSLYGLSIRSNAKVFREMCFNKITENFNKVIETEDFKSLDADVYRYLIEECVHKKVIKTLNNSV